MTSLEEQCLEWLNSDWQDELDLRDFVAELLSARDQQWKETAEKIIQDERYAGAPYAINKLLEEMSND